MCQIINFETIKKFKHLLPRSTGNQWKISKLHKQLHVAYNTYLFGSHQNIYTRPQEHIHIAKSKKTKSSNKKRDNLFDWQMGNQLSDHYVIKHVTSILSKNTHSDIFLIIKK